MTAESSPAAVQRARVLIVAPNASSQFGGESFIPLQYFRILRQRAYPAKLVTHARNRRDLERVASDWLDDITFIPDTAAHRLLFRIGERLPKVISTTVIGALMGWLDAMFLGRAVRRVIRTAGSQVIHQPTPVSPLAPSGLHRFGLPLIVGPMNGGMAFPTGYDDLESPAARRLVALSRRFARLLNRLTPGKRRAAMLLVANPRTRDALPFRDHADVRTLVENGVDRSTWAATAGAGDERDDGRAGTLRLVFMGRLVDWKLVDITLEAVRRSRLRGAEVTLDVLGDGPERARLERLAEELSLGPAVRFHGFLAQEACAPIAARADALILNSAFECGGAVVLEAMALGLPVIASDWGGPADYLDPACGILVAPVPRATFADRLAEAIVRLAEDPQLRRSMGRAGARKVAEQFDWHAKVETIIGLYAEVAAPARG